MVITFLDPNHELLYLLLLLLSVLVFVCVSRRVHDTSFLLSVKETLPLVGRSQIHQSYFRGPTALAHTPCF